MRVACVGEAMIELSMEGATSAHVGVAGDTLNTAVYLKRSAPAVDVDYVTRLGDDPFSDRIREFIGAQGIGTDAIETKAGGTPGLYAITTAPDGERAFTYWRSASAAREMFQYDGRVDFSVLEGYDLVYLSGISLAILPPPVRANLIDWLRESDLRIAYDSNHRPRLWESADAARSVNAAMWSRADIALPSLDDEMQIFDQSEDAVIVRFIGYSAQGALKRAGRGPFALGADITQDYPPAPRVVDTTAAGDSFNGGYLGAILSGEDPATALRRGHDLAAQVVGQRGAIVQP